jgi:hypothetical protein
MMPAAPAQVASMLERQAAALGEACRFVFPSSTIACTLEELGKEKLRLPASAAPKGVATIEMLVDSLGVLSGEDAANFVDQRPAAPIEYGFDFVASVTPDSGAASVAGSLLAAANRQFQAAASIVRSSKSPLAESIAFRCFRPQPLGGHLIVALSGTDDAEKRVALHSILRLPEAPFLRPECALPWKSGAHPFATGKPINPHIDCGQQPGWWKGGAETKSVCTRGMYEYCHYMQDNCDDNGWGCAYRSLQTCVSWYRMQFYSTKDVPSITEIQQVLKNFDHGSQDLKVGGKRWIGTQEGMCVLQNYLGVEFNVMFCRDVDDMVNQVPQMLQHLQTQGTPIMMGVGQRAFTLVGVCYDGASGEAAFLIVDPHYTGADELKKILDKGWVGWKKIDFFKKEVAQAESGFINCVLPKPPQGAANV